MSDSKERTRRSQLGCVAILALLGLYLGGRWAWRAYERVQANEARAEAQARARVAWAQLAHCLLGSTRGSTPYRRYRDIRLAAGVSPDAWPGHCVPFGQALLAETPELGYGGERLASSLRVWLPARFAVGWEESFLFDRFWSAGEELTTDNLAVAAPDPPAPSGAATLEATAKVGEGGFQKVAMKTTGSDVYLLSQSLVCHHRGGDEARGLRCREGAFGKPKRRELVVGPDSSPLAFDPFGATWRLATGTQLVAEGSVAASADARGSYVVALRPDGARSPKGYRRGRLLRFPLEGEAEAIDLRGSPFDVALLQRWVITIDRSEAVATISVGEVDAYDGGLASERIGEVSARGVELVAGCVGSTITALVFESNEGAWIALRRDGSWRDLVPIERGHHHLACTDRGAALTGLVEKEGGIEVVVTRCGETCAATHGAVWERIPQVKYDGMADLVGGGIAGLDDRWKDGAFGEVDAVVLGDDVVVAWFDAAEHAVRAKVAPIGQLSTTRGRAILDLFDRVMPQVVDGVRVEATEDFATVLVSANFGAYALRVEADGSSAPLNVD